MKKILATLGFLLWWGAATHAQNNPCIASTVTNCTTASGNPFTLATATNGSWPMACFGEPVALTATPSTGLAGLLEYTSTYEDCSVVTSITALAASNIISSWWTATNAGFSASGTNLAALFTPTNCGVGTVTFTMTYSNTSPCGQPVSSAVVFSNALSSGNQSGFDLGMDFVVNSNVTITALGTFDPNIAGYTNPTQAQIAYSLGSNYWGASDEVIHIYVGIFDVSTGAEVTSTAVFTYSNIMAGAVYTAIGGSIFQDIMPVTLTPGTYSIVASGYQYDSVSGGFRSGNTSPGLGSPTPTFDTLGGALTLSPYGVRYYGGPSGSGGNGGQTFEFPTQSTGNAEVGGNPTFLAGTFIASSGAISNTTVTMTTNFTVVNVTALAPTNASACGVTLLSSNVTAQSFLVPVATIGPTNLAILATSCPTLPASQLPSCWSLNGYQTNLALVNLTAAHISTNICSVGISSLTNIIYVEAPPVIVTQPTNQTVFQGSNATFTVAATGTTNLLYQWRLGGTNIAGATNASLLLTNIMAAEAGYYSVVVTNLVGSATSSNALLTITSNRPPVVTLLNPTNGEVFAFSPNNILVSAWAYQTNGSISYVDFYNGTNLLGMTSSASSNIYSFLWTNVSSGYYALSAVALSSNGLSATNAVTFTNNAVPAVSITTPTNFQTFLEVTNVLLSATASELSGTISNVVFYNLTNLIGIATQSGTNYTFLWTNLSAGIYPITAVATDNRGATTISALAIFKVTSSNPPIGVVITSPTNLATFQAESDITISATATNSDNTITNVEFYANSQLLGNATTAPYSILICCWSSGNYALTAIAYDSHGGNNISSNVNITVSSPLASSASQNYWDNSFAEFPYPFYDGYQEGKQMKVCNSKLYVTFDDVVEEADGIAIFDGTNWSSSTDLPSGAGYPFSHTGGLEVDGSNVYVASSDRSYVNELGTNVSVYELSGTNWLPIGDGFATYVFWRDSNPDGQDYPQLNQYHYYNSLTPLMMLGSDLYLGGTFTSSGSGNANVQYIARLNRQSNIWEQVGNGLNGPVLSLGHIGNTLVIGGMFTAAGGNTNANHIAMLVDGVWTNMGSGVPGTNSVLCIQSCGSRLYAGGDFTTIGGITNANGIGVWRDGKWSAINRGVIPGAGTLATPMVESITTFGDSVFLSGSFKGVWGEGTNEIISRCVVEATWSEALQQWCWSDLDTGAFQIGDNDSDTEWGEIRITAILNGTTNGLYNLFVGGLITQVGSTPSLIDPGGYIFPFFRWRMGYPKPDNGPIINFTGPANQSVFTNATSIAFTATIVSSTNILTCYLYDGNTLLFSLASGIPSTNYSASWPSPPTGIHYLKVVATDANGVTGSSQLIQIVNKDAANPVSANNDSYKVRYGGATVALPVLTNDTPTAGSTILSLANAHNAIGIPQVSTTGQFINYTPIPNQYGSDFFNYTVTNASLSASDSALVWVKICVPPTANISLPYNGGIFGVGQSVNITGNSFDLDGVVTNFAIYVNGSLISQTTNNGLSLNWSNANTGFYEIWSLATDDDGMTNASTPVIIVLTNSSSAGEVVTAQINNLSPTGGELPGLPVVSQGLFDLQGYAQDSSSTTPVAYQILLHPVGDPYTVIANVTPGATDSNGFFEGRDNSGDLGVLDLTRIANGAYDLELIVHGGAGSQSATASFILNSQLKIGQFSFSEQDLILPVSGIPITITRTYNSLNPLSSDFGYGWSFAINSMDVQLDEVRQDIPLGLNSFNDDSGGDNSQSYGGTANVRVGGGRDVSLTLPTGQRVTFAYTPHGPGSDLRAYAAWVAPAGVSAQLSILDMTGNSSVINCLPFSSPQWQDGGANSTYENCDVPGWVLTTTDGTQYNITRGPANYVTYEDPNNAGLFITALVYGTPTLTSIVQPSGSTIVINPNSIYHKDNNATNRTVNFSRDGQGRITAIYDPNNGTNGSPLVQYIYNQTTGNLLQVVKLVDATAGTFTTNRYDYNNPNFPHYITSIENANGVPVARNFYDDSGRLTAVEDADGNLTQFVHNLTNDMEVVIDRRGNTNSYVYDTRGNVIIQTNALGQVMQMAYDDNNNKTNQITFLGSSVYATSSSTYDANNLLLSSTDALGRTSTCAYNSLSEVTNSIDARNFGTTNYYDAYGDLTSTVDALGDVTLNVYANGGLLLSSTDALGNLTTNYYDSSENLVATAVLDPTGTIIVSTNSFAYDLNGNRTNSVVYRHTAGRSGWVAATTSYFYDAQNRLVQTIDANGGTNTTVYNAVGKQSATIDALGHTNSFVYDDQNRLIQTVYPDGTSESSAYDSSGNRTNSVDRLSRTNVYVYDALNRLTNTIYADNTTTATVYDGVGRVQYSIDARGTITAFGYDVAGQQVAVTNAFGTGISNVMTYAYDANGNRTVTTDIMGRSMTSVYDALNRTVTNGFPDGTFQVTVYDALGRKASQTDQATNTTWFGYDSLGRLICVTNALQQVTKYYYDEAGNQTNQVDALNRQTTYEYDALGRRTKRTLPGGQYETMAYDVMGNLHVHTDFNGLVITNQYDCLNRLTNRWQGATSLESYAYDAAGGLTNRVDTSGTYFWVYDLHGRMTTNVTPVGTLFYAYDNGGNLTNLHSATIGGVNIGYQYDALSRLTNVVDNGLTGTKNTAYTYDLVGNLQTLQYPNGVTNLWQYDSLNRLTNLVSKLSSTPLGSFYYKLGANGNRTSLAETVSGTSRAYAWSYDNTYRLTNELISGGSSGTIGYGYDAVGNRTNRSSSLSGISPQTPTYGSNDWLNSDSYDSNGNTTLSSSVTYQYDYANRLTNNGSVSIVYGADGNRISKKVGTTNILYLVATVNPTGYPQVVEELNVVSGVTNLSKVYTHGMSLISQRESSAIYFFGLDGHGSTRFLTDGSGTVVNAFAYDAYGNLIASNSTTQTAYLYSCEQWDTDLQQYYNRARYYQPNIGRFWTMDSYQGSNEDPISLHKYVYCEANPVDKVDPNGNVPILSNVIYGKMVERAIAADFLIHGPSGEKTSPLFTPISSIINAPYIPLATAGRPDLVLLPNSTLGAPGQIWEIKPVGSFVEGSSQLWYYLFILHVYDKTHKWVPGTTYVPPRVIPLNWGTYAFVFPSVGGVILYQVEDLKLDILTLLALGIAADNVSVKEEFGVVATTSALAGF